MPILSGGLNMATKVFRVSFELEVEDDGVDETAVEEAVTQAWDEEVLGHGDYGTRCGVRFLDAVSFNATLVERRG